MSCRVCFVSIVALILSFGIVGCGSGTAPSRVCQQDQDCKTGQSCSYSLCMPTLKRDYGKTSAERIGLLDFTPDAGLPESDANTIETETTPEPEIGTDDSNESLPESDAGERDTAPEWSCVPGSTRACFDSEDGKAGTGRCKAGTQLCDSGGEWGPCQGQQLPIKELCNGRDDDCDGKTDEDFEKLNTACQVGVGECFNQGNYTCNEKQDDVICDVQPKTPGTELCDGKDNDCNGKVDDDGTTANKLQKECYPGDASSAGLGLCKKGKQTCSSGSWGRCVGSILPAKEVCNGKDDDCDGKTDEGLVQECYDASPSTVGKGICKKGKKVCIAGRWSRCQGQQKPRKEACDGKGLDDDCDGKTDEGCNCTDGKTQKCGISEGVCRQGTQTCKSGKWGVCLGQIKPTKETCNGKDDDCDGQLDETFFGQGDTCTPSVAKGVCSPGEWQCLSGKKTCVSLVKPSPEECDGKDNDCDGQTDETFPDKGMLCKNLLEKGECQRGVQRCSQGNVVCVSIVSSQPEQCDGKDNDCDGQTDETFPDKGKACVVGKGICEQKGIKVCSNDGKSTVCNATPGTPLHSELCNRKDDDCDGKIDEDFKLGLPCVVGTGSCRRTGRNICAPSGLSVRCNVLPFRPKRETCNGKDDDCDGKTDEFLRRHCYEGASGTQGVGICRKGGQICIAGKWGKCIGQTIPTREKCNRVDDDCDGKTDEGCQCVTGTQRSCGSDVGACKKGTQLCVAGKWDSCLNEVKAVTEKCNGKDDDCDGKTDEDFADLNTACKAGQGACERSGKFVCRSDGAGTSCNAVAGNPGPESCNGKDDDCDGKVDELLQQVCYTGAPATRGKGICKDGIQECKNGSWDTCKGQVLPTTESCNKKDDNCNGAIDEGNPGGGASCKVANALGECATGTQTCSEGTIQCVSNKGNTELCRDGKDNDCDGKIDEGCGPKHTFAVVKKDGSILKQFGVTRVKRVRRGDYEIISPRRCGSQGNVPLVMVEDTLTARAYASVSCTTSSTGQSGAYLVTIHDKNKRSVDMNFHFVIPLERVGARPEYAAVLREPGKKCQNFGGRCNYHIKTAATGLVASMYRIRKGVYQLRHSYCSLVSYTRPIFASLFDKDAKGYIIVRHTGPPLGHCEFYVYDENRRLADKSFALWLPYTLINTWAYVDASSRIRTSSTAGDTSSSWSLTKTTHRGVTMLNIRYTGSSKPSAALIMPRVDANRRISSSSIQPLSGNGILYTPYDARNGTAVSGKATVIFVQ